jgi:predicted  nucleic acid-binding Zn-ribbon protein
VSAQLDRIEHSLRVLHWKVGQLMAEQDQVNTDVATIEAGVASLNTAAANIQVEIAALQKQNPALDLTGLDKAAADVSAIATAISAIPPAPPVPPAGP